MIFHIRDPGAPCDEVRLMEKPVLVFQEPDSYSHQANNSARGNQAAGVERTRTNVALFCLLSCSFGSPLNQPAYEAAAKDCQCGCDGYIEAYGKRERPHA